MSKERDRIRKINFAQTVYLKSDIHIYYIVAYKQRWTD